MGADCCKNVPPEIQTREYSANSKSEERAAQRDHGNEKQKCASSQFFEKAQFWFDQSYPNWREVLNAEFYGTETICIPESLDVGSDKYYGPTDYAAGFDNNKDIKIKVQGERGEEMFFHKFRMLKLGGILINGFFTQDFMKVMKDCGVLGFSNDLISSWKENKRHFECDFIFIHQRIGIVIVEVKSCDRVQEVSSNRNKAEKQLERSIPGLVSLYKKMTDRSECPFHVCGFICMPCVDIKTSVQLNHKNDPEKDGATCAPCQDANTSKKPKRETDYEEEPSIKVVFKSLINNTEKFKTFLNKLPQESFSLTDNLIRFITSLIAYRPATYISATCNALEIYRRIEMQDFQNKKTEQLDTLFLNRDQLKAVESEAKHLIISGPPRTGKTLCLIIRALEMAKIDKPGRVMFVLPLAEELAPKIKKISAASVLKYLAAGMKLRIPEITSSLSFNFTPHDDLFLDEVALEYKQEELTSFHNRLALRAQQPGTGRTTIAITGWMNPAQVAEMAQKKTDFTNFTTTELKIVIRGTKTIIDEWNCNHFHFPKEYKLRIGHNITGADIERHSATTKTEIMNILRKRIPTLLMPLPKIEPSSVNKTDLYEEKKVKENGNRNKPEQKQRKSKKSEMKMEAQELHQSDNNQPQPQYQCTNKDIAVLIVPSWAAYSAGSVQQDLTKYGFHCGSIIEQVHDSTLIAVDNATRALSYEWPIVIVIVAMDGSEPYRNHSQYLIAASRAIAKLIVIELTDGYSIS